MNYLNIILTLIAFLSVWHIAREVLRKNNAKHHANGINRVVSHIHSKIKKDGEIDLILDGQKMTVVELKKTEAKKKK